jgi:biopolymer transport protein ExbB
MSMNQMYGLANLWAQGDWMIRGVTVLLVALSIASWTVMLGRGMSLWRHARQFAGQRADYWAQPAQSRRTWAARAAGPLARLACATHEAHDRIGASRDPRSISVDEWLSRAVQAALETQAADAQRGMPLLASISSTTPFIGLFGTVWGIYHALQAIGASGQASLDRVAGPVGEALVMTAFGLAVAIPASFGYNLLMRLARAHQATLRQFGRELHAQLAWSIDPAAAATRPGGNVRLVGQAAS